jgi:hypothetical protein
MKHVAAATALLGGLGVFLIPPAYAQGPGEHSMVTPDQLQWKDAAGLPPGTQLVVIEGPMSEAVPFTVRINSLPAPKSQLTGIQQLSTSQ